jgi:hypothetical protein
MAFVCPHELVRDLHPIYSEPKSEYVVNAWTDPVIEWMHSRLVDGMLYPGRFYYCPQVEHDGVLVPQPELLTSTAERLFRWLRRRMPWFETDWGRERLGPIAAAKFVQSEISIDVSPLGV